MPTNPKSTKADLTKKVEQLEKELSQYKQAEERAIKRRWFVFKKVGTHFFLGTRLKNSLVKLFEGDTSKDNLAEIIMAAFYRFTRIGIFAIVTVMVPIILLWQQNSLLSRQNDKIDKQNVRLDQQTALLEADRRSAVILESGNVLDAVSRELADPGNTKDSLSFPLIGRIIALSRAMKEYKYLDPDTDEMTKE